MTTYYTPARLTRPRSPPRRPRSRSRRTRRSGLRDMSPDRHDRRRDGVAHFLEVNVSPGLTETSMFPMSVAAAGHDLGALYSGLIDRSIERFRR